MQTLRFSSIVSALLCLIGTSLLAQNIVLKDAKDAAVPIAIQAFLTDDSEDSGIKKAAVDVEAMLTANLIFSRLFKPIPSEAFLEPDIKGPIDSYKVDSWRQVGADFLVRARLYKDGGTTLIDGYVFNILKAKVELKRTYRTGRKDYTILAHQFGDDIVEIVTGSKGLFSTKVSFVYLPPNSRKKEIWAMDFNGRNPEPLIQNGRTNLSPAWSRDGRNIYYTSASNQSWHLWRTPLRGGKAKQITNFSGSALGPTMMPNGREMVVSLSRDGNPELYLLNLEGKIVRRLTKKSSIDIAPAVSPKGDKVCYSSGRLGALHIFVLDIATGKSDRKTRVGTLNDSCAWHPLENRILFSGMDLDREFDIFAMDADGYDMERLTYDAKNNETPSWSPDGKLVVFSSRRSGRDEIYVMKGDGSQITKITNLPGQATQPDWSPRLGY